MEKNADNKKSKKKKNEKCGWQMRMLFGQQQQKRTKFPQIKGKLEKTN